MVGNDLYTKDRFLKYLSANARADVVRVHAEEGEEDLPRVDKRVLNHCREVGRQRSQAVDEAKIDAGQEKKRRERRSSLIRITSARSGSTQGRDDIATAQTITGFVTVFGAHYSIWGLVI